MSTKTLRDVARIVAGMVTRRSIARLGVPPFVAGVAAEAAKALTTTLTAALLKKWK